MTPENDDQMNFDFAIPEAEKIVEDVIKNLTDDPIPAEEVFKKIDEEFEKGITVPQKTAGPGRGSHIKFSAEEICGMEIIIKDKDGTPLTARFITKKGQGKTLEYYNPPQRWLYYQIPSGEWLPKQKMDGSAVMMFNNALIKLYKSFEISITSSTTMDESTGIPTILWAYAIKRPLLLSGFKFVARDEAIQEAVRSLKQYILVPPLDDNLIQLADAETFEYTIRDVLPPRPDHDPNITPSGIPINARRI